MCRKVLLKSQELEIRGYVRVVFVLKTKFQKQTTEDERSFWNRFLAKRHIPEAGDRELKFVWEQWVC